MLIASPKELQLANIDYVVVFEGTKKYHITVADFVNPYTLHVIIPGRILGKMFFCAVHNFIACTMFKIEVRVKK